MPSTNEKEKHYYDAVYQSKDIGKISNHGFLAYSKHEKVDDMYPLKWTGFNQSDVKKSIDKVLGPLSLFAPFTHEDIPEVDVPRLERPVTPIDEEIRIQPQTFKKMAQHVRRRIMAKQDVPYLSTIDQNNLAGIITGEVNSIWPDLRRQIDDPFLTAEQNKELNRRIAVHIVTVSEQLFHHYLDKAQVLNSRGVFSGPANMSRLKTQLALEASELFDILKIRRYIVNDIKKMATGQGDETEALSTWKQTVSAKKLTYQTMLERSRPKSKEPKVVVSTTEHEIKEMQDSMPILDTSHLLELVANFSERDFYSPSEEGNYARPSHISEGVLCTSRVSKEDVPKQKMILKRCSSQPLMCQGESLLEELGLNSDVKIDKLIGQELVILQRERDKMAKVKICGEGKSELGSQNIIENDLIKLTEPRADVLPYEDGEDNLPPLIQAITRHARHDDLKQRMKKEMNELLEKQTERGEKECVLVRAPTHPQPDTVVVNLGKTGSICTSDIRVSERVCMSSITLKQHSTVYNDLQEEIDLVTVKNLDKFLVLSDEIHEVYEEIMKSVPNTHMELDDDPLVLSAPYSLDVSGTMASATLSRKLADRVINPDFCKSRAPPWGEAEMKEWVRTPASPPRNVHGEARYAPLTPDMAKIHNEMHDLSKMAQTMSNKDYLPSVKADKVSRTYASWLQWWKSSVTSDDYMKYLSTLETDFLGALFHFYDSEYDGESDEADEKSHHFTRHAHSSTKSKLSSAQKERMCKMAELQALKTDYKAGFWNANSVLMGGLGKDPEIENEMSESRMSDEKVKVSRELAHPVTLYEKANQRRILSGKRDQMSCMSKATGGISELEFPASQAGKEMKTLQDRLESVWQQLHMPDKQRLDMAIKYSCNDYFSKLAEVIEQWELVAELILQREALLATLEKFERQASDPNRFFSKNSKNSTYRLEESRQRTHLYKKIDALDADIKDDIVCIKDTFQDIITYKGRPYLDKMKWDRTEMLYWLAEERKQHGLKYEAITRGLILSTKPAQLQPILPSKSPQ